MNKDERLSQTPSGNVEIGIRALADSLGEGLLVIQKDEIVFVNERLAEILGSTREKLADKTLRQWSLQDSNLKKNLENRNRREKGEVGREVRELSLSLDDGRILFMRDRTSLIDWEGAPATVHFLEDITLRKSAEKQLVEQKEVNAILADTVRRILESPLPLNDIAGTVLDSAMSLTGSRSGVLVVEDKSGERILERRCGGDCPVCVLPSVLEFLESDKALMNLRRPGRINGAFYLNEVLPITDNAYQCKYSDKIRNLLRVPFLNDSRLFGHLILADVPGMFGPWDLDNMEKIAEVMNLALIQSQAVDDLKTAKEKAEDEAEARSLFLANVSHEIRSPLNGVMMMASLLQDSDLTQEQAEQLNVVLFSAKTIDRLIRDLTDLTQIRTGKITLFNEDFNLDELCRHILESNRPEALRKGLDLEWRIDKGVTHFTGDRERIGQILSNLLTNAIKYTETGHVRLDVSVPEPADGELRMEVSDTGIGIPREQQNEVFGLFNQGRIGRRAEGTGIGLAVVKELSEVMNGRIHLESEIGSGSRFTVFLPPGSKTVKNNLNEEALSGGSMPEAARILVAEDEGVNRLYMRTILERDGWDIDEAGDGLEAVSLARKFNYDLILMDISMPRMDGLEASSLIREIQPSVPIIAITAHAYEDDRKRILDAGINDIVLKPIDENGLKQRLMRYLRTS